MSSSRSAELAVREPSPEEAPAIAELLNAHAHALFGESELAEQEVREWFALPDITIRVAEEGGRLVGYADVHDEQHAGTRFDVDLRALSPQAAEALLAGVEAYIRERARDGAVVHGFAPSADEAAGGAYERAGYRIVRHSFQMRTELAGEIPEPRWPDGIAVRTFRPGEEERVHEAHMDSFADHWDFRPEPIEDWRRWLLDKENFDPSLWFLAEHGGELAGIALCSWHFSGDPQFGWVNVLGVRPRWRRQGLGGALLRHAFREFAGRGATRVGLGVDAENTTGAVRLYERAGMRAVRRSDSWEKRL